MGCLPRPRDVGGATVATVAGVLPRNGDLADRSSESRPASRPKNLQWGVVDWMRGAQWRPWCIQVPTPITTRRSIRMSQCPTIRASCCPTHRRRCHQHRSSRCQDRTTRTVCPKAPLNQSRFSRPRRLPPARLASEGAEGRGRGGGWSGTDVASAWHSSPVNFALGRVGVPKRELDLGQATRSLRVVRPEPPARRAMTTRSISAPASVTARRVRVVVRPSAAGWTSTARNE